MKLGPYELNNIYCGDCIELTRQLPDGCIDLVFTSPPYNLQVTTGGGFAKGDYKIRTQKRTGKWDGGNLANGYDTHTDAVAPEDYITWQKKVLCELWRVIKPTGAIYYNHKPRVQNGIVQLPLELNPGLPIRQIVIWKRAGGVNFSPTHYLPVHEWIMIFAKPDFQLKSQGASGAGDVWDVTQEGNNPHPAPFPLGLPLRAIETVAPKIVLDPFMGSGTTGVAAKEMGVTFLGFDISPEYCRQARERIAKAKTPMFAINQPELVQLGFGS